MAMQGQTVIAQSTTAVQGLDVYQPMLLDLEPIVEVGRVQGETIDERFQRFHERNPHVYRLLREMALGLKARRQRMGMKGLFEVLRWQYMVRTAGDDFKLNNDYTAPYARLLMAEEPQLRGFFETRKRTAVGTSEVMQ